jgi:hypothetical protein
MMTVASLDEASLQPQPRHPPDRFRLWAIHRLRNRCVVSISQHLRHTYTLPVGSHLCHYHCFCLRLHEEAHEIHVGIFSRLNVCLPHCLCTLSWSPGKSPTNTVHVYDIAGGMWACAGWMADLGRTEADSLAGEEILFHNEKSKVSEVAGMPPHDQKLIAPLFNLVGNLLHSVVVY